MPEEKAENTASGDVAEVVEKKSKFSIVWLIPIIALLLGGWLLIKSFMEAGIPITLTFKTASGLEAGKTKIEINDVKVGLVDTIEVSDDIKYVVLTATMDRNSED